MISSRRRALIGREPSLECCFLIDQCSLEKAFLAAHGGERPGRVRSGSRRM